MKKGMIIGIIAAIIIIVGIIIYSTTYYNPAEIPSTTSNTESAASANTLAQEGSIEIKIKNFEFAPKEIKIKVGSNVTWINEDVAPHTVTSDSGEKELDSSNLAQGESYEHTFTKSGVFNYHCSLHTGMKGKIVVE